MLQQAAQPTRLFATDVDEDYDVNKFYTTSADSKGHDTVVRAHVPKAYAGLIAALKDYFPQYRSSADFIRDAMVHRIQQLRDIAESGVIQDPLWSMARMQDLTDRVKAQRELEDHVISEIKATSLSLYKAKKMGGLVDYLSEQAEMASVMAEPFRTEMLTLIDSIRVKAKRIQKKSLRLV